VAEDSASFDAFIAAMKTPKDNPERKSRMQAALKYAAEVPLRTARLAAGAAAELRKCGDVSSHVVSDYRSALYLLEAAVKGATENVFINAESLDDKELAARMVSDARSFIDGVSAVKA
jgi:formiminotetrahydrofolate cyclodeaminase